MHGGALLLSNALVPYALRQTQQQDAKQRVALQVAQWLTPNQVIFVNGGSTLTEVVRHLPPNLNLTVVTNNLHAALVLADRPDLQSILLGGTINTASHITSGLRVAQAIGDIRADLCLIGGCSLHTEQGLTAAYSEEAQLKQAMIRQSAECAVVLTADKLGTIAPYTVVPLTELDTLFIDAQVSERLLELYRTAGIQVVQAGTV